jgi:hypothetical protein
MPADPATNRSLLSLADAMRRVPQRSPIDTNIAFQGNLCKSPGHSPATTNNSRFGTNRNRLRSEVAGTAAARWAWCFGLAPQREDCATATADGIATAAAELAAPEERATATADEGRATAAEDGIATAAVELAAAELAAPEERVTATAERACNRRRGAEELAAAELDGCAIAAFADGRAIAFAERRAIAARMRACVAERRAITFADRRAIASAERPRRGLACNHGRGSESDRRSMLGTRKVWQSTGTETARCPCCV